MKQITVLGSAVETSTASYSTNANNAIGLGSTKKRLNMENHSTLKVVWDVTVVPGVDTVTPSIEYLDPVSGKWIAALTGAAKATTGTIVLLVGLGVTVVANLSANDRIPGDFRVTMTHSAGSSFTYSIAAYLM